jgi:CRISPR/Cas system-associated exonuclease Cas4 (RecB family)
MSSMRFISPSILKEYLTCPRFFNFKRIHRLSLLPSEFSLVQKKIQERIDHLTFCFFSAIISSCNESSVITTRNDLEYLLQSGFYSYLDLDSNHGQNIFQKIDEAIITFLFWLIHFLWNDLEIRNRKAKKLSPIMINEPIKELELGLYGRPSAVFRLSDDSTFILIQYYNKMIPFLKDFEKIQAALYERILNSLDMNAKAFISINYYNLTIKFEKFTQEISSKLDSVLEEFKASVEEKKMNPRPDPPCEDCEFRLVCQT